MFAGLASWLSRCSMSEDEWLRLRGSSDGSLPMLLLCRLPLPLGSGEGPGSPSFQTWHGRGWARVTVRGVGRAGLGWWGAGAGDQRAHAHPPAYPPTHLEREGEARALAALGGHADRAAVGLHQLLGQVEAQAGAAVAPRRAHVHLLKRRKDVV